MYVNCCESLRKREDFHLGESRLKPAWTTRNSSLALQDREFAMRREGEGTVHKETKGRGRNRMAGKVGYTPEEAFNTVWP